MSVDDLVRKYPKLYHMAEIRNWNSICSYGLLSTSALLDLFEYTGQKRFEIESQLRSREFRITHPVHGEAFIRDQDPLRDRPVDNVYLVKCLVDMTPQQWFELLNRKTFFWTDLPGLKNMLGAKLYQSRTHYVITVCTKKLLERYAGKVTLSSINSGSLYFNNGKIPRTKDTFRPLEQWSFTQAVKELAVDYSVPDIADLMTSVTECKCSWANGQKVYKEIKCIWPQQ